tara:strand:- start:2403 stop:2780 length:378 start_codon:yes stop_codon:yes gene_type:complete
VTFLEISKAVAGARFGEVYKVVSNICVKNSLLFLEERLFHGVYCIVGLRRLKLFVELTCLGLVDLVEIDDCCLVFGIDGITKRSGIDVDGIVRDCIVRDGIVDACSVEMFVLYIGPLDGLVCVSK